MAQGVGMKLESIDPATGELIESFDEIGDSDLEAALARAQQAFHAYRKTSFADRAGWLRKAAQILESEKDKWARLMTREMGKTYKPTRRSRPTRTEPMFATCRSGRSSR